MSLYKCKRSYHEDCISAIGTILSLLEADDLIGSGILLAKADQKDRKDEIVQAERVIVPRQLRMELDKLLLNILLVRRDTLILIVSNLMAHVYRSYETLSCLMIPSDWLSIAIFYGKVMTLLL